MHTEVAGLKRNRCGKGSMTVEAAIVLPVFLCVVISIVMLARVVLIHAKIQHALMETAEEMASSAYLYQISGLRDIHDTARNGLQERAGAFADQADSIAAILGGLEGGGEGSGGEGASGSVTGGPDTGGSDTGSSNTDAAFETALDAAGNPLDVLKNLSAYLAQGTFDDIKTGLFTPIVKSCMTKYLSSESGDSDAWLKAMGIDGGFDGLDFSESAFLSDREENIDLVVRYEIDLPLPINVLPRLELVQRAASKAWLTGNEASGALDGENAGDDIWQLDNFTRGRKFRTLFGGNLPSSFPVISGFEGGKAVMIKSIDLTDESYRNTENIIETLDSYLKELSEFDGQETPWGSGGIVIKHDEIRQKELLLVIPENTLPAEVGQLLSQYPLRAAGYGVRFRLERYGLKSSTDYSQDPQDTTSPTSARTPG